MILPLHQLVRRRIADAVARLYSIDASDPVLADISVEVPPNRAPRRSGRAAGVHARAPAAQGAARRSRRRSRPRSARIEGFTRVEAAPSGYINFFLDRGHFASSWLRGDDGGPGLGSGKAIVEHTAINPNKAAHIGHLRNAALGDAFGRLLRFLGRDVEIQNYIDDTGVQVADVAVGFRELEHKSLDEVRQIAANDAVRLLLLGPVRAGHRVVRGRQGAAEDPDRRAARHRARRQPHRRHGPLHRRPHRPLPLRTMARMNIGYDLLTWEGDILRLHFWAHAFEYLKKTGAVYLQTEGKLKGCWVMRIEDEKPTPRCRRQPSEAAERARGRSLRRGRK